MMRIMKFKKGNLMAKYAEEDLERKIKPRIPQNYNSLKIMKFQVRKEPHIKQFICPKMW